jgi:hypothetical protein
MKKIKEKFTIFDQLIDLGTITQEQLNKAEQIVKKREGRNTRGGNKKPLISDLERSEEPKKDKIFVASTIPANIEGPGDEVKRIIEVLEKAGYTITNKETPLSAPVVSNPPPPPPTIKDREIALREMEMKTINNYSGDRHQNTQISEDQRILISILYHDIAKNPYPSSRAYAIKNGIPWNDKEFEDQSLIDFLADYLDFGLPLDREGRAEVGRVLEAYFRRDQSKDKHEEPVIS